MSRLGNIMRFMLSEPTRAHRTQDSSIGPGKVFRGSIQLESQQLIPKRTRMFCLAPKKINHNYFHQASYKESDGYMAITINTHYIHLFHWGGGGDFLNTDFHIKYRSGICTYEIKHSRVD
jgi:hypothetical protein